MTYPKTKSRIGNYFTIGGSSTDDSRGRIAWSIDLTGWKGFIATQINPILPWFTAGGVQPHIWLHNPFGFLNGQMVFDQWLTGPDWVRRDFIAAFSPLLKAGVRLTCYIGQVQRLANIAPGDWLNRIQDSLYPMLHLGAEVAIDSFSVADPGPVFDVMLGLQRKGVVVYGEAMRPSYNFPDALKIGFTSTCDAFDRGNPDVYPDALPWRAMSDGDIKTKGVLLDAPGVKTSDQIRGILAKGFDFCGSVDRLMQAGVKYSDLVGCVWKNTTVKLADLYTIAHERGWISKGL